MPRPPSRRLSPLKQLQEVMAILRSPEGCPWDREQDHRSLRFHAVEEVYELLDAIEAGDEGEMVEELGDLLLQVVFHCQLGRERRSFDLEAVARRVVEKLVRRHPHVFGDVTVASVDEVWANWDRIKRDEKAGTRAARESALDGIPRHLPALMRAEKLVKKARKAGLAGEGVGAGAEARGAEGEEKEGGRGGGGGGGGGAGAGAGGAGVGTGGRRQLGEALFALAAAAQARGWSAEALLREATGRRERGWRREEARRRVGKGGGR